MQTALVITQTNGGWQFRPAPDLPVAALVIGKPVEEAATLLPRLFNLCSGAQAMALRLALGLPAPDPATLRTEILRDHLLKLCVLWPGFLGLPTTPLPPNWADPAPLRHLIWGDADPQDFDLWLASGQGVAPVIAAIAQSFAPGEATATLPLVTPETALQNAAMENSVAARHASAPAMRAIEASHGRGPYWRAAGLIHDIAALLNAAPAVQMHQTIAIAPAARGAYAVQARALNGKVTAFARRTPTDHLCAPGGALQQSLNSLPAAKTHLLPLLIDILAPCVPVQLPEVQHA
ncbi:MAG: hypothetical protein I8H94_05060 [Rhodobacteraceae bacterium]|nr:hypothetical protein [Paracoccaceae bacterium]